MENISVLDLECPAQAVSAFTDLDAEVAGLQAWLECVATPVTNSDTPDPGGPVESTFRWEDFPPSGMVMDAIAGQDLGTLSDDELLSRARRWRNRVRGSRQYTPGY